MNNKQSAQLELFSSGQDSEKLIIKPIDTGFPGYIKLYEKVILTITGFVISGIIAFCLGVEKGKNISISAPNARFDGAGRRNENPPAIIFSKKELPEADKISGKNQLKNIPVKQEIILKQPLPKENKNGYTIQIASYQAQDNAKKEMLKLRRKGFSPMIIIEKGYNVICVGAFNNKKTAKSLLSQLKSKYGDCYIRRL